VKEAAEQREHNQKINELFECWDNDSSGVIDLAFIECALSLYKPAPLADTVAQGNCCKRIGNIFRLHQMHEMQTIVTNDRDGEGEVREMEGREGKQKRPTHQILPTPLG